MTAEPLPGLRSVLLRATYMRGNDLVRIAFYDGEEADYTTVGEVTSDEVLELVAAGGGDVAGWQCRLG